MGYVYRVFGVQPYDRHTALAFAVIGLLYGIVGQIELDLHPLAVILLKSVLITLVYGCLISLLKLSKTVNGWVSRITDR